MHNCITMENICDKSSKEISDIVKEIEKNFLNLDEIYVLDFIDYLLKDSRRTVQKLGVKLLKNKEKLEKEIIRVENMYNFDKAYAQNEYIIGVDEVGRGPLAGPIVAAAVVLDLNYENNKQLILGINDSKKLSAHKRKELSDIIKEKAVAYSICEVSNKEIDEKGIAWSNNKVFLDSIRNINVKCSMVLSDGYKVKGIDIKNREVIKGDAKSASIACASILAKVYRDELMIENAKKYEGYGFENNVGYGTEEHVNAIRKRGVTDIHRLSFLKNIL